ncbi:MAG: DUF6930 domain-containing protein [Limisphaerales bacterium]
MPSKFAPPPPVTSETWNALLVAAAEFAALEPWAFASDAECVGLIDPVTGETRLAHVLGNAGEVFAAVAYRRDGVRWLLGMFSEEPDLEDLNHADGMDCLKLEFVPKKELRKEDLAVLNAAGFRPAGKGCVWPQFRAAAPGWHPWFLTQTEADQLLADLPRLTAFLRLFEQQPDLYDGRAATEIPFLPHPLPDRPLTAADLDWRPLLLPPATGLEPFEPEPEIVARLNALPRNPALVCEFDCTLLPGGSFLEQGRPCFGRFGLLAETREGLVLGMDLASGALSPGEAAGWTLLKTLHQAGGRPGRLRIRGQRLRPVLAPVCAALDIILESTDELPALEEAVAHLTMHLLGKA